MRPDIDNDIDATAADNSTSPAADSTSPAADNSAAPDMANDGAHARRDGNSHGEPRGKLHCFNYYEDIPGGFALDDMVEVQFKNTRKGYYKNSTNIPLEQGDWVAVEAQPGHDIGQVSLTGALVRLQMRKAGIKPDAEIRRVFRKARPNDFEKFEEAKARENDTMIRARKIAESLHLKMKIGDVEYQGDGNKAIFYYIADERVDFRQLIKILADTFKVRIEMKQIGARQEAGRIGGIGPCGRPLCCSSWMTNFVSVATGAARYQDISLNPQKLAGQCAKLKCCLNFEVNTYCEAVKRLPDRKTQLETADNTYFHFKTDIFKREITYSTDKSIPANLVTIDADRAFEVIRLNREGVKPLQLARDGQDNPRDKRQQYSDILDPDNLNRFDNKKKKKHKKKSGAAAGSNPADRQTAPAAESDNKPRRKGGDKPRQSDKPAEQGRRRRPDKGNRPKSQHPDDKAQQP